MNINMNAWAGRVDGPGPEHARWNSTIQPFADGAAPGVALIGFACDEGVRRNQGRVGSHDAPDVIRAALGGLAVHHDVPLYDVGTIDVAEDLEAGHEALTAQVGELTRGGHTVIVLGGGHETAYGSHRGMRDATRGTVGIVNLDAHFDLRTAPQPTSGTPFKQLSMETDDFRYFVLGISQPNNTKTLFDEAAALGVTVVLDEELAELSMQQCAELLAQLTDDIDHLHLSIDLDVLPAGVAPGVSAPAAWGVSLDRIRALAIAAARTGKLRLVDVVELNPRFDIDGRTAKVAARLIDDIVSALPTRGTAQ